MSDWKKVGDIVRCQIHTDRMVHGDVYRHELLTEVDALWLSPDGVVGQVDDRSVLHGHHRLHPTRIDGREKHRAFVPHRLLSFGFTGHYDRMADRFGAAEVGCAGEDIVVAHDQTVTLDDVSSGVQIRRGDRSIDLVGAAVAAPCVPFTKYLLGERALGDEKIADYRSFLDNGIRGFVVGLANHIEPVDIRPGDEFWARSD